MSAGDYDKSAVVQPLDPLDFGFVAGHGAGVGQSRRVFDEAVGGVGVGNRDIQPVVVRLGVGEVVVGEQRLAELVEVYPSQRPIGAGEGGGVERRG